MFSGGLIMPHAFLIQMTPGPRESNGVAICDEMEAFITVSSSLVHVATALM